MTESNTTTPGITLKDLIAVNAKFKALKLTPSKVVLSTHAFSQIKAKCEKGVLGDYWLCCGMGLYPIGSYEEFRKLIEKLKDIKENPNDWMLIEDEFTVGWRARLRFAELVEADK